MEFPLSKFQACIQTTSLLNHPCSFSSSKPTAPQTSLQDGSSYFLLSSPLVSYKVKDRLVKDRFAHSSHLVPLKKLHKLSIAATLSFLSLSRSPGSPRRHCRYICMGPSNCCTSVHMCLFSNSTTNVTLNTLYCSTEHPCLPHVSKQT